MYKGRSTWVFNHNYYKYIYKEAVESFTPSSNLLVLIYSHVYYFIVVGKINDTHISQTLTKIIFSKSIWNIYISTVEHRLTYNPFLLVIYIFLRTNTQ